MPCCSGCILQLPGSPRETDAKMAPLAKRGKRAEIMWKRISRGKMVHEWSEAALCGKQSRLCCALACILKLIKIKN